MNFLKLNNSSLFFVVETGTIEGSELDAFFYELAKYVLDKVKYLRMLVASSAM